MSLRFPARLLLALLFGLLSLGAWAATITVNTAADSAVVDGVCSLREAVQAANLNQAVDTCAAGQAGADQIVISVAGTILLNSPVTITEAVSIIGAGRDQITLSGRGQNAILVIETVGASDDVTLRDMSLIDGVSGSGGGAVRATRVDNLMLLGLRFAGNVGTSPGGAVYVRPESGLSASVIISDCLFENNQGSFGGALYLSGPDGALPYVEINASHFSGNEGTLGGAAFIDRVETIEISRSVFIDNVAQTSSGGVPSGGALHIFENIGAPGKTMLIERSSLIDNFSYSGGGALYVDGVYTTTLVNSTVHGNSSTTIFGADAISLDQGAALRTFFSTLADNGTGVAADLAVAICDDCSWQSELSIVSTAWPTTSNCDNQGSIVSSGYNIDTSGDCLVTASDSSVAANLAPLSNETSPGLAFTMPVRKPVQGSAAVDGSIYTTCQIPPAQLIDNDQLGRTRPVAINAGTALCDIGAIEFQASDLSPLIFSDRFESP